MNGRRALWSSVDRLLQNQADPLAVEHHGLTAIASTSSSRRSASSTFSEVQQAIGAVTIMEATALIARAREAVSGPLVSIKGVDVAAFYPSPEARRIRDVDLLTDDVYRAATELQEAGWVGVEGTGAHLDDRSYNSLHQVRPMISPGITLHCELHRAPHWPTWGEPPLFEEILRSAVASRSGVEGVLTPSIEHHTLIVLAHSWARQPFEQLSQLLDFTLMHDRCDPQLLRATATRWKIARLLALAERTVVAFEAGTRPPLVVRAFAPHIKNLSMPSETRQQVNRYAASFFVTGFVPASQAMLGGLARRSTVATREAIARRRSHRIA